MRRKSRRVFQQISVVLSVFQEAVASMQIVKAFTAEEREVNNFDRANRKFFKAQFRADRMGQATSPINEIIAVMVLIMLFWYGARLVYFNELDADDFMRFIVLLFAVFQPLKELSGLNNVLQRGLAAAERIFEIIDTPTEEFDRPDTICIDTFRDAIVINDMSFQYTPQGPFVLRNINLTYKKGQTVAFVGHSGSGKTTMVNLVPRFYDVTRGQILMDGNNLQDLDLISLRKQIGIVTQETFLFNDTIRYNIAYGIDTVTDEAIIEAAKAANAWEFIEKMELGLDSEVGERGVKLSGGQKQRLAIARAILKNPPILILDEATSSLDTESERLVQDAIDRLMKNRTVLVVAHRLSTIIHADMIVVMENGEVVDTGKHVELLETCPVYKNLYQIQFKE